MNLRGHNKAQRETPVLDNSAQACRILRDNLPQSIIREQNSSMVGVTTARLLEGARQARDTAGTGPWCGRVVMGMSSRLVFTSSALERSALPKLLLIFVSEKGISLKITDQWISLLSIIVEGSHFRWPVPSGSRWIRYAPLSLSRLQRRRSKSPHQVGFYDSRLLSLK